jgi:hypothetical protein
MQSNCKHTFHLYSVTFHIYNPDQRHSFEIIEKKKIGDQAPAVVRRRPVPKRRGGRLQFQFRGPLSFLTVFSFSAFVVEMLNHALGVRPGGSQLGQNVVRAFSAGEDDKWLRLFSPPSTLPNNFHSSLVYTYLPLDLPFFPL